ncbi:hypothetical protein PUNSTDRAFT_145103 [Punctularia strigosozonata HHB-11173 SS5]|uniref:uncharacterized protein n=1 Tax=Punctularia strigosozonata (strain HHB-11173) TaxID=741275 RepID=UPI00044174E4|nr:uncharacterized protein PUNSTDRAFT_145103 [Punctularia strigosozonata HHB-11173 SS5]EIN06526.1 hypothetical protein PUNSTDRAFT_145103 [Punctularia strigosozonata HHB-11173 SS5]
MIIPPLRLEEIMDVSTDSGTSPSIEEDMTQCTHGHSLVQVGKDLLIEVDDQYLKEIERHPFIGARERQVVEVGEQSFTGMERRIMAEQKRLTTLPVLQLMQQGDLPDPITWDQAKNDPRLLEQLAVQQRKLVNIIGTWISRIHSLDRKFDVERREQIIRGLSTSRPQVHSLLNGVWQQRSGLVEASKSMLGKANTLIPSSIVDQFLKEHPHPAIRLRWDEMLFARRDTHGSFYPTDPVVLSEFRSLAEKRRRNKSLTEETQPFSLFISPAPGPDQGIAYFGTYTFVDFGQIMPLSAWLSLEEQIKQTVARTFATLNGSSSQQQWRDALDAGVLSLPLAFLRCCGHDPCLLMALQWMSDLNKGSDAA